MKMRISMYMLFLNAFIRFSTTFLSSGIKEIIRNNLKSLKSLKTKIDSLIEEGTNDAKTIMVSNMFQPSEKNDFVDSSAKYLIDISTRKIKVIK
jgi:prophage maintenance system killer protein